MFIYLKGYTHFINAFLSLQSNGQDATAATMSQHAQDATATTISQPTKSPVIQTAEPGEEI
jgi:hypothetical protein